MSSFSVQIHEYISKGDFQNAYLLAEEQYNENPESLNHIRSFVEVLCQTNQPNLIKKAEHIIKNSKYDYSKYPDLSFLLMQIYTMLGDTAKIKELKKNNEKNFGWEQVDVLENVEDISSLDSEDLLPDSLYFKSQIKDLLKYLLEGDYKGNKELKKISNLINNNYIDDSFYLLKEFAQKLEDRNMTQFIFAELALADEKFEIAEKWYNKIIDKINNKAIIYNRLGDISFAKGKNKQALSYYSKSYEYNPDDENTNLDLIRSYIMADNIVAAKKIYITATDKFGAKKTSSLKGYIRNKVRNDNIDFVNGLVVCLDKKGKEINGMVNKIYFKSMKSDIDKVVILGDLARMTIESIKLAELSLFDFCKEKLNKSITVSWEYGVGMVDGNSAGLAVTIGLIAIAKNKKVPDSVAFTGAIDHSGSIRAIGGLSRKLIASYINGIKKVYIPKENFSDLQSVNPKIKSNLSIKMVTHYTDVVEDLWN